MLNRMMRRAVLGLAASLLVAPGALVLGSAQAAEPIKIGFGMAQTGPLAAIGKAALVSMKIWEEEINAKGGLIGRPVKLIYYDDQSNGSTVPGIYTKLLDVDKVDIAVSGYATNMIAPAMPIMIQKNRTFLSLFGMEVNKEFKYPKYFSMVPLGPDGGASFATEFFNVAATLNPKPQTVALVGADAEYPHKALDGARRAAKAAGLKIVYDKTYPPPPATTDYSPILRAIQATNPELIFVASYPADSVGMVRAANEIGLKARMFGGGMVGLQATPIKTQLGPLLNGIVNYDFWIPAPTMNFAGVHDFLKKYQAKASSEGVDLLGYYLPPFAYGYLQILGQAIESAKSVDQDKLAAALRGNTFKTIVGDIKFGKDGEWDKGRVILVQYNGVKGNDLEQFRGMDTIRILGPAQYKTGEMLSPYQEAKK
jgi:branched-chain amino acid transport system substrate-binding protein